MKCLVRFLLGIGLFLTLTACGGRPSNVLSEKEMVSLLADMEIAEAYVNTQNTTTREERTQIGERILKQHGVSPETLDTTLAWYGRNMDSYSELFAKVDKEILKRKDKLVEPAPKNINEDNLWPFNPHVVISPLSGFDNYSFSFQAPEIEKGKVLNLSFFMPDHPNLKSTLGVEYTDGFGEAVMTNSSKNKVTLEFQTDTAKKVARIFGTIHLKETKSLPVYIDSLKLNTEPFDSLGYRNKKRSQKTFYLPS